jgi:hypothetical protein
VRRFGLREATFGALALMVVMGAISDLLYVAAFQFRPDWFANPGLLVAGGSASAELLKWASITDVFSYYLPTGVVALAIFAVLRRRAPNLARAGTVAALGYVIAGSIGAASLAMVGPPLMAAYQQPGADHAAIEAVFSAVMQVVFRAIWQLIDSVWLGFWMVSTGWLMRADQPAFARLAYGLGGLFWFTVALNVLGLGLARDATLGIAFALWDAWFVWLALLIAQRRSPFGDTDFDGGAHGFP